LEKIARENVSVDVYSHYNVIYHYTLNVT